MNQPAAIIRFPEDRIVRRCALATAAERLRAHAARDGAAPVDGRPSLRRTEAERDRRS